MIQSLITVPDFLEYQYKRKLFETYRLALIKRIRQSSRKILQLYKL